MIENTVFNKQNQALRTFILSVLAIFMLAVSLPIQAKTGYVSDELKVPMRSGASNGHRIIKFVKSGTSFSIIGGSDDDKFVEVELSDGKTGWISAKEVMNVPSGRDRLVSVNKRLKKSRDNVKELKSTISQLKKEMKALKGEKNSLQSERTNLSNSLEDLKITAANPLSLSKKNKQLKKELGKIQENEAMLEKDNQSLRSNVAQEWFIIGGAVAIGSLILGLLLTRINWRKKRDSWGDNF